MTLGYQAGLESAQVGVLPLSYNRHTAVIDELLFEDVNLTTATAVGHIRLLPDQAGAPLASINFGTPVLSGVDTIWGITISKAVMEALPLGKNPGENTHLFYDIQITFAGRTDVWLAGPFNVIAGVVL